MSTSWPISAVMNTAGTTRTPPVRSRSGASAGRRARDLRAEERAGVDAGDAAQGPASVREEADAHLGCGSVDHQFRLDQSTSCAPPRSRRRPGRNCPPTSKEHLRPPQDPGGREATSHRRGRSQYESEVVYHKIRENLEEQGVLFLDTDTALKGTGTCSAVLRHRDPHRGQQVLGVEHCRGPAGPSSTCPRACTSRSRCRPTSASTPRTWVQFERTLIIVDEGAYVHYVEGCTAPIYSTDSLHSRGRRDHREEGRAAVTRRFRTGRPTCTTS